MQEYLKNLDPIYRALFVRFLMTNRLYNEYIYETTVSRRQAFISDPYHLVNGAFIWSCTKRGFEYWEIVYQKWVSELRVFEKARNERILRKKGE